jgi:hypothetical protein
MGSKRTRPTGPIVEQRVAQVVQLRMSGAKPCDVRHYVSGLEAAKQVPWVIPNGGSPLCERQIRRYMRAADAQLAAISRTCRDRNLRWADAVRKNLYRRALAAGDLRTALAVLQDLARLHDLYPAQSASGNGADMAR